MLCNFKVHKTFEGMYIQFSILFYVGVGCRDVYGNIIHVLLYVYYISINVINYLKQSKQI